MREIKQDGITIFTDLEDLTDQEIVMYRDVVAKHNGGTLKDVVKITIADKGDGTVDVSYDKLSNVKFERLARINE